MATRKEIINKLPKDIIAKIEFNILEDLDRENRPFAKADHLTLTDILETEISLNNRGFALTGAFSFLYSREGEAYWWEVYRKYFQ